MRQVQLPVAVPGRFMRADFPRPRRSCIGRTASADGDASTIRRIASGTAPLPAYALKRARSSVDFPCHHCAVVSLSCVPE
jgi:hypothetical protein